MDNHAYNFIIINDHMERNNYIKFIEYNTVPK